VEIKPKAFVLLPFAPEFIEVYEGLIEPALMEAGYDVSKADSLLDQRNILDDIVRGIATADLAIAEVTVPNPNVFYELGLSHGLRIPTILLAQSLDEVPFDLRSYRILVYSTHFAKVDKLKQDLRRIAEEHRAGNITFGSPVTDFLPPDFSGAATRATDIPDRSGERAVEEVEDEEGLLDLLLESTAVAEEIESVLATLTDETIKIGKRVEDRAGQIQKLTAQKAVVGSTAAVHKVITGLASDMLRYSHNVDEQLPTFERIIDNLAETVSAYVNWIRISTTQQKEQLTQFRLTVSKLLEGSQYSLQNLRSLRDQVSQLREYKLSKALNQASRQVVRSLEGIIDPLERLEAVSARALPLIDEKLDIGLMEASATFWSPPSLDEVAQKQSAPVITDVHALAVDFWPKAEHADDINQFIAERRHADRIRGA
jgi:hypothetical protein